ncbi:hypothetical protein [Streptomyces sp. NPDC093094]|uniref:hypothetical protein n=1 Tax=Streptomyces sp. NPDC093094 TaxID=3366026 RepID=UPI00380B57E6
MQKHEHLTGPRRLLFDASATPSTANPATPSQPGHAQPIGIALTAVCVFVRIVTGLVQALTP